MDATRRELLKLAAETRFQAASLEKVMRLGELLETIGKHPRLARSLVLKGGTALNLCFGPPTRLSVDLDFNYVGQLERAAMLGERPRIEADLERLAGGLGYAIQRSAAAHAGRTLHLSYRRTVDGLPDRIAVDVNFLHRQCLLEPEERTLWHPGSLEGSVGFPILSFDELAAGKLIALLARAAPRDAWDADRLVTISEDRWPGHRSKRIFVAMAGTLPHPLDSYSPSALSRILDRDVKRLLHPMLLDGNRPTGEELRRRAAEVLEPLLSLTPEEREYSARLQRGELVPALLFPDDPELSERVASSPPLLWKASNAKKHRTRS